MDRSRIVDSASSAGTRLTDFRIVRTLSGSDAVQKALKALQSVPPPVRYSLLGVGTSLLTPAVPAIMGIGAGAGTWWALDFLISNRDRSRKNLLDTCYPQFGDRFELKSGAQRRGLAVPNDHSEATERIIWEFANWKNAQAARKFSLPSKDEYIRRLEKYVATEIPSGPTNSAEQQKQSTNSRSKFDKKFQPFQSRVNALVSFRKGLGGVTLGDSPDTSHRKIEQTLISIEGTFDPRISKILSPTFSGVINDDNIFDLRKEGMSQLGSQVGWRQDFSRRDGLFLMELRIAANGLRRANSLVHEFRKIRGAVKKLDWITGMLRVDDKDVPADFEGRFRIRSPFSIVGMVPSNILDSIYGSVYAVRIPRSPIILMTDIDPKEHIGIGGPFNRKPYRVLNEFVGHEGRHILLGQSLFQEGGIRRNWMEFWREEFRTSGSDAAKRFLPYHNVRGILEGLKYELFAEYPYGTRHLFRNDMTFENTTTEMGTAGNWAYSLFFALDDAADKLGRARIARPLRDFSNELAYQFTDSIWGLTKAAWILDRLHNTKTSYILDSLVLLRPVVHYPKLARDLKYFFNSDEVLRLGKEFEIQVPRPRRDQFGLR